MYFKYFKHMFFKFYIYLFFATSIIATANMVEVIEQSKENPQMKYLSFTAHYKY